MAGGSTQTQEVAAEVGVSDKGFGERGSGCPNFGNVLRGSCTGSIILLVGDMGDVPTHWYDIGRLPPQGGLHTDRTETAEGNRL